MNRRRFAAIIIPVALIASLLTTVTAPAEPAVAAVGSQFDPGNIISDSIMYNGSAMTPTAVQQFLVSKVPQCNSSYACLMNYTQNTPTMPASAYCSTYQGAAGESAATIIAKVGAVCNISQKSLIVLLEKEQGLVSSSSPSAGAFKSATGFGCPDTAPCDPNVGGFFYQVYDAARQFQVYAANPLWFNYQAGRNNNILFNPNTGCGSSSVFIQNKATAGLYDYTPYQPNAAALANLYGTGNGCSAYGNRNFWRIFTDWFGSTTSASSIARTVDNSSVYLLSGTMKYPISSMTILNALSPLGQVTYVSQTYLDSFATQQVAGRVLRSPGGSIYFYDAGIKLPFSSCGLVVDYGGTCSTSGFVQLTDEQLSHFATGPAMTSMLATTAGSRYYITLGTKREVLDDQSQAAAGLPVGYNVLTEGAVSGLAVGQPIVRDGVLASTRGTNQMYYLGNGAKSALSGPVASDVGAGIRSVGSLNADSMALIASSAQPFTGTVQVAGSSSKQVLTSTGRFDWQAASAASLQATTVPQPFVDGYPALGSVVAGSMIKTATNATVYVVMDTRILPVGAWESLVALAGGKNPVIMTMPDQVIGSIPQGPVALTTNTLVRSPGNATVYLVNGVTNKIPLSNFAFATEAGFTNFSFTTQDRLDAYPESTSLLGFGVTCGTTNYVGAGGAVHKVNPSDMPLYPFTFVPLDNYTCQLLNVGADATNFIRVPNGSIYYLDAGTKRPISSMATYQALSQGRGWLNVVSMFADLIPSGPAA